MHRILGWGCITSRQAWRSFIILFKCMRLGQCALAILLLLFHSDLWPFGFSINTTGSMQEDVPFPRSEQLWRATFKKFCGGKIKMNSLVFKLFFTLSALWCASTGQQCNSSVGLENGKLPDQSILASTHTSRHYPYLGRLNNKIRTINETKRVWGAWCARESDVNQYIEVDLQQVRNVSGIATQGYSYGARVESYQIMYSVNGKQWFQYKENSTTKIFDGNRDFETIVRHSFNRLVAARFIRFNPRTWHSLICMRVEIYACELPEPKVQTTVSTTKEKPTTRKVAIRTKTVAVTNSETTKLETDFQVIFVSPTPTDVAILDGRRNSGDSICYNVVLFLSCIAFALKQFL